MELTGKHVVVTGTTSGIGKQLAGDLLLHGARVTSVDRAAQETGDDRWTSIAADVRSAAEMKAAFAKVRAPVDVLVVNAGVMRRDTVLESPEEDFDLLVDTNLKGAWLTLKYCLPLLREDATILFLSSRHALTLPKNPALYGLTKRWGQDMMEVVAKTYPRLTIKILCPGPIDTPLSRVDTTPEDFARKQTMMSSPAELSAMIIRLLGEKTKTRLLFDQRGRTHFLL